MVSLTSRLLRPQLLTIDREEERNPYLSSVGLFSSVFALVLFFFLLFVASVVCN